MQEIQHDIRVVRKRRLRERAPREYHQPKEIAPAPRDEIGQHPLGHLDAIARPEIERLHAARDIQREHDVAAVDRRVMVFALGTRASQRHDEKRERDRPEHGR